MGPERRSGLARRFFRHVWHAFPPVTGKLFWAEIRSYGSLATVENSAETD